MQVPSPLLAEPPCYLHPALCCEQLGGGLDGTPAGTGLPRQERAGHAQHVPLVGSCHALRVHTRAARLTVETMPRAWPRGTIVAL